jgi:hypothetical protein
MKENDFFFFLKNLGTSEVRMQKYPKSTSTQKVSVSDTGTVPFLEYLAFLLANQEIANAFCNNVVH